MQLKKDTDYSLRLLAMIVNCKGKSISARQLTRESTLPRTKVVRLCKLMAENGLIEQKMNSARDFEFEINRETVNKTVFDVIKAVEGAADLFAVFDMECYVNENGHVLREMGEKIDNCLRSLTIGELCVN